MGLSFSGRRNQNHHHHHHHHIPYYPPQQPPPYYYHPTSTPSPSSSAVVEPSPLSLPPPPQPPPPPPLPPQHQPQNNYVHLSPAAYPNPTTQFQYQHTPSVQSNYYYSGWSNSYNNYPNPMMGRANYSYFPANYGNGWHQMRQSIPQSQIPPPYVEHQSAKVVKNDVNVHKDTIKLEIDENHPDQFLVSFIFDAHYDGSITIYYFAKEEQETCTFTPAYPEAIRSVKVPFEKGVGQRFCQVSGTGVDLGFFDLESLGKPSEDDVFPLVIYAEVCSSSLVEESSAEGSPRAQVTQAIIEKTSEGSFHVKALQQILWIDGVRYELRDLYGIGNSSSEFFNDDEPGKECVICMTEPKNTAVMPCRHLCMCSDCAQELRLQSNKCPICRQPITELMEIKINNATQ